MTKERLRLIIFDLLDFKIDMIITETNIKLNAISEALPPNNSIVKIDEKIINKINPFIDVALVLKSK